MFKSIRFIFWFSSLLLSACASSFTIATEFPPTNDHHAGPDWWALQPIGHPAVPTVRDAKWCREPVDAFILAALETKNLHPSPEADRRTLIRRVTFDLIGLPPTPEEIDAFVGDESADAYEKLVDRLLSSPHYGEQWARHWLDVVRFGENEGFERNRPRPNAWRYRDWVIDAFNSDLPYDRFVREQIAGDVLAPNDPMAVTATGYLVCGSYDSLGMGKGSEAMIELTHQDYVEKVVGNLGQTFLGLTVNCARCHDHKFDPIRQTEYYQLAAALAGVGVGESESAANPNDPSLRAERDALASQIQELHQKGSTLDGGLKLQLSHLEARAKLLAGGKVQAVISEKPRVVHVLVHGDIHRPGDVVSARGLGAIAELSPDLHLPVDAAEGQRRAKLAQWITDLRNPLPARVIVNRLWHYHFGAGIVRTPSDFGFNGARPSHPELLDYLASELIDHAWSLKHIQRLIVLSAAYRQGIDASTLAADPDDRWLSRKSPARIEAENVRDAMLQISGELNPQMGGPGYEDASHDFRDDDDFYLPREVSGPEFDRRSLYRTWHRGGGVNPFLETMDCPDPSVSTPVRSVTITPLQALALLNGALTARLSERLARRIEREAGTDVERQIDRGYRLALARDPSGNEVASARTFIAAQGLGQFCLVLFNSSEFLYVD